MEPKSKNSTKQIASPEREYVKIYLDFLDNSFLTAEEQMVFIALKSFDFEEESGPICQSMETICKRAKMSEQRARKNINALVKKGIVKKIQRGLTKTNLYALSDYAPMWDCGKEGDIATAADNKGMMPGEHIAGLERMGHKVGAKEKMPGATARPK